MKIRTLVMALAAFSFMLTACENKANKEQNAENQTEMVAEEQTEEAPSFTADDVNQIGVIYGVWDVMPIPVLALDGKTDIERFAASFCNEYSNYEPNLVLYDYLNDEKEFKKDLEYFGYGYNVDNQKDNGYILCRAETQFSKDTDCYCWKRDNGHSLVAFWLEEGKEGDDNTSLLAFYDIDPATNTMTPEPALSEKVAEAMAQYDAYSVRLPQEGKDVGLIGHKINIEEDNCDNTYYMLRWNGNDFTQEQVTEEAFME